MDSDAYAFTDFEGFGEEALRILFFTRKQVTQWGGQNVSPAHLLLALVEVAPETVSRFVARRGVSIESVVTDVKAGVAGESAPAVELEIPISAELEGVLGRARAEARALRHDAVDAGHLTLALSIAAKERPVAGLPEGTFLPPEEIRRSLRNGT